MRSSFANLFGFRGMRGAGPSRPRSRWLPTIEVLERREVPTVNPAGPLLPPQGLPSDPAILAPAVKIPVISPVGGSVGVSGPQVVSFKAGVSTTVTLTAPAQPTTTGDTSFSLSVSMNTPAQNNGRFTVTVIGPNGPAQGYVRMLVDGVDPGPDFNATLDSKGMASPFFKGLSLPNADYRIAFAYYTSPMGTVTTSIGTWGLQAVTDILPSVGPTINPVGGSGPSLQPVGLPGGPVQQVPLATSGTPVATPLPVGRLLPGAIPQGITLGGGTSAPTANGLTFLIPNLKEILFQLDTKGLVDAVFAAELTPPAIL